MITTEFRQKVKDAILKHRENYQGMSDAQFAKTLNLNSSVYSRLKSGETEKIAADTFWIEQGRKLNVSVYQKDWKIARTSVYAEIEENITFCKSKKKAIILIDECGIGKTFCAKHVIKNLPNAFYFDCSQASTPTLFIRRLAQTLGVDSTGRLSDVKENLKYYINLLNLPFILLDDAGYLDPKVFVIIIELWNGTEDRCGWMMIGDDSLQAKFQSGLDTKKTGYKALFSRFSDEFVHCVPLIKDERTKYMQQLIGDVATVNLNNQAKVKKVVNLCMGKGKTLRHLETLIQLDESV
ncbi:ATP-binding protein [Flavobacterium cerinum]|uniref:ATP-binding protein n=1 Tax=Flavobacterium cerinum TaxID=2502784 RepID=A0A444HEJ8_9FLAO|nr:ATP-binding protein [Flavobacterium cerinum]RWX03396.1 ATP-binding protein [Flavobacterium cerinum]